MRGLLIVVVGAVMAGAGASSATVTCVGVQHRDCVVNNGLAPPNPENVLDDDTYAEDDVYVRNVGCPPGWPASDPDDPCPSSGAPTQVETVDGGIVAGLTARDSSTITMSGGFSAFVFTYDSAIVAVAGGWITHYLITYDSSAATMSGGYTSEMYSYDSSSIAIVGRHFEVDGVPVPYGDLAAQTGRLTGTLASGDAIETRFNQGGGYYTGTIALVEAPDLPTLSPYAQLALMASLLGAGLGV